MGVGLASLDCITSTGVASITVGIAGFLFLLMMSPKLVWLAAHVSIPVSTSSESKISSELAAHLSSSSES